MRQLGEVRLLVVCKKEAREPRIATTCCAWEETIGACYVRGPREERAGGGEICTWQVQEA
jgi:hypothetical protein